MIRRADPRHAGNDVRAADLQRQASDDSNPGDRPAAAGRELRRSHRGLLRSIPASRLPYLGLSRVFVLTGFGGTCSRERGGDEQPRRRRRPGDPDRRPPTCGKPYGFYPADNFGKTYFAIQFQGRQQQGIRRLRRWLRARRHPQGLLGLRRLSATRSVIYGRGADIFAAARSGYRGPVATCPASPRGAPPSRPSTP